MSDGIYNLTSPVVTAFPNLFEPKAFKGPTGQPNGEPKYSLNLVFPSDSPDLKGIKEVAARVAKAKWPGRDLGADFKAGNFSMPWTLGDKLADQAKAKKPDSDRGEYQRGNVVIAARSKFRPRLAGIENGKIVDYEDDAAIAQAKGKFYFGVQVLAQLNLVAYGGVGRNPDGVTAYLNMVLTTNKGERLGGGTTAAEAFKGYAGSYSTENPLADEAVF